MLTPRKHQRREGPVCWHFDSCETLAKYLTCFPHYSSSSQSCPSCFSAFILRVREGKMRCHLYNVSQGPEFKGPERGGGGALVHLTADHYISHSQWTIPLLTITFWSFKHPSGWCRRTLRAGLLAPAVRFICEIRMRRQIKMSCRNSALALVTCKRFIVLEDQL